MKNRIMVAFIFAFVLILSGSPALAALTVSPSLPGGNTLTEGTQASVSVSVTNTGSSAETNIVVSLVSSPSWFSVVSDCSVISSLQKDQSSVSSCIITPTGTGSGLILTATATSAGGTQGSGQLSGITVNPSSSTLTAQISSDSSVSASSVFYASVTVTAPSSVDSRNVITTVSVSGGCTIDTSYVSASQNIGNITKGTSKSPTSWKVTAPSLAGACVIAVSVTSDNTGSASPTKTITITGSGGGGGNGGSGGGGSTSAAGGAAGITENKTAEKITVEKKAVPPGLANNTKLQAAIEKVLAKGKLSQSAVDNLMRLSELIRSDVTDSKSIRTEGGKSMITEKIKYSGAKKIKNFMVHAKIPKEFAAKAGDITVSAAGTVEIVESDPEFLIAFAEALPNQELEITYTVNKMVAESVLDLTSSEVYAESLEEIPSQKTEVQTGYVNYASFIMVLAFLIAFVIVIFLIRRKIKKSATKLKK